MGGGGSQDVKQESTFKMSPEQRQIFNLAFPFLTKFGENPPGPPTGTAIAPFNPTQQSAQDMLLQLAGPGGGLAQYGQDAAASNKYLMSPDLLNPETNPALQGTIDAATRPIIDDAMHRILPAIRGDAVSLGQYSGSKRGQMEGDVAESTARAVGDTAANITTGLYGQNLDAMTRATALAPQMAQMQMQPGLVTGGVGDIQHALTQAQTSESYQQQQMADMWDLILGQELLGSVGMIPGGTNTSTASQSGGGGGFGEILGGISSGLSLLPSLFAFL